MTNLVEWFNLYLGIEHSAGLDNISKTDRSDLASFLNFLKQSAGNDHPDPWVKRPGRREGEDEESGTDLNGDGNPDGYTN